MGVPKFYRWISERYPCLSTVAREYQLPDFDNLYLDMNGIIHVCSHPNDADAHFRISEAEIFKNIFDYIDFIFRMVKPKKYFFMAVDGVAPRAKMNQQRDRRFRSAKEAHETEKAAKQKGEELPTDKRFDSNCISPGTEFMERLHEQLKYFVVLKLSTDPVWQRSGLKIYLSGHDAPGEGEHKAMDFIRFIRSQKDYDPNTRHCIYGQDADLIMLALCTHEPHIALLREEIVYGKSAQKRVQSADKVTFHLLHVNLLREYLDHEFAELKEPGVLKQGYNLENIIDDWLLMCFLVGNDFLPHLPNLHIAHDALPILHKTYCSVLPTLNGYLHDQGRLNLKNFEVFLRKLGERDREMFERVEEKHPDGMKKTERTEMEAARKKFPGLDIPDVDSDEDIWEEEFRQHKRHYYMSKMGYDEVTEDVLREQAEGYIRAVQWNLHYYYNGVQSWSWYYPHHYSPFISDIKNFSHLKFDFERGKPFLPFQQLVSIMPTASRELVPAAYRRLMTEDDSPLKEYFPDDFETDLNGKTQEWEAVVLIKYIEEEILLNSMKKYDHLLTDTEKMRNKHGAHLIYEYTPKALEAYASPIPGHKWFPDIVNSHAKLTELPSDEYRLEIRKLRKGRLPNTQNSYYFPGFPSLRFLPHRAELLLQGCTIFQQASRGYNMILHLEDKPSDVETYAKLIGQEIHINYPHLKQAIVSKVCSNNTITTANGTTKMSEIEVKDHARKLESLHSELKFRWGIHVGDAPKLILYCKPLIGRKYMFRGKDQVTIEKQWSDSDVPVLHNTIISDLMEHETEVASFKTLDEVFVANTPVFLMTLNEYGMQGSVKSILKNGHLLVECKFREEPDFMDLRKREPELRKNDFLPAFRLAKELGLENHLVARLTGCVQVQLNSQEADTSQTINIGLNLKFNKKNEEVVGYSKRIKTKDGRTEWRFSQGTLATLRELLSTFGDFYVKLRTCFEMDKIPLEKCCSGDEYGPALNRVRELAKWIKEQPCSKAPRQKSGGIVFDEGVVEAIQKHVDAHNKTSLQSVNIKAYASDVYLPGLHLGLFAPDPKAFFCLYDRVVNIRPDITIPIGLKGTVIGIHKTDEESADDREATYEILFDEDFPTGNESRGARGNRVATLSSVSMINITHGARMNGTDKYHQEIARQGHGAWGSQAETRMRIMSKQSPVQSRDNPKKKSEKNGPTKSVDAGKPITLLTKSPKNEPSSSSKPRQKNGDQKNEQKWFQPVSSRHSSSGKVGEMHMPPEGNQLNVLLAELTGERHFQFTDPKGDRQTGTGGKKEKKPNSEKSAQKSPQKRPPQPKEINISVSELFNEIQEPVLGVKAEQGSKTRHQSKPLDGIKISVEDLFKSLHISQTPISSLAGVPPPMVAPVAAEQLQQPVQSSSKKSDDRQAHEKHRHHQHPHNQNHHQHAHHQNHHQYAEHQNHYHIHRRPHDQRGRQPQDFHNVPPPQNYHNHGPHGSRGAFHGRPKHYGNMHGPARHMYNPHGACYPEQHHYQHNHEQAQQRRHYRNDESSRAKLNTSPENPFIPSQVLLAQGSKPSGSKAAPDNAQRGGESGNKNQKKKAPLVCEVAPIRGPMWKTEDDKPNSKTPQPESSKSVAEKNQATSRKSPPNPPKSTTQQNQASTEAAGGPAVRKRTGKTNRMGALFEKSN